MRNMDCLQIGKSSMLLLLIVAEKTEADGEGEEGRKGGHPDIPTGRRNMQHSSGIIL